MRAMVMSAESLSWRWIVGAPAASGQALLRQKNVRINGYCPLPQVQKLSGLDDARRRAVTLRTGGNRKCLWTHCSNSDSASEPTSVEASGFSLTDEENKPKSFWKRFQTTYGADMRAQVAKLGLAAVFAYGLLDGITYTSFFVAAFLGYEKSTGKNPAANIKALLGVVVLMWAGNNVTRPFRVAGAAALAPFIDKCLKKIQKIFNLPNLAFAFMVSVAAFAGLCLSVVGILILSRWGR